MLQKLNLLTRRHRLLVLIAGLLLLICVVGTAAVGFFLRNKGQEVTRTPTSPVLVDGPSDSVDGAVDSGGALTITDGGSTADDGESRLDIRLSAGQARPETAEPITVASGEPLSDEEIEWIVARLPELVVAPEDSADFKIPEDALPPPRTGETIDEPFPPSPEPVTQASVETGPLEVLRFAPEGEIPLAPFVSVTFNQPMVPLTTLDDLAAEDVPVRLEPDLPGVWRWVGAKTLTFEHEAAAIDRLPMATEFLVTVPAGTESATGGVLADTVSWTFSTPPPTLTNWYPGSSPQPLEPLLFAAFDQRIDQEKVLATVQVAANGQPIPVQLATEAEVRADEAVSRLATSAGEGRWLAFRAGSSLPADAAISITIGPGTPSAEGPLVTPDAQSFDFRTYAPLRIERHGCSWSPDRCPPLVPFFIDFNNPIDVEAYDESMLLIEPALPGATVDIFGNTITIRGVTEGRTTYRITVDGAIQDVFGQTLGEDSRLTFRVGSAEPVLVGPDETFVTLDPAASKPAFTVYAINHNRLKVRVYAVEPSDWPAFKTYLQEYNRQDDPPEPPGRKVMDETVPLESAADVLTEGNIDLSEALDGEFGHLIIIVEPDRGLSPFGRDRYRDIVQTWVQVTQIGLDAFSDHSEMVVWTSDLQDGTPLPGVTVEADAPGVRAVTGSDGTARFNLPEAGAAFLTARQGDDVAFLPRSASFWGDDVWQVRPVRDELRWYVFDDRQMYRPGEEVHVKGWLRRIGGRQNGDVGLVGDAVSAVGYQVIGPQGNELIGGRGEVNALGGFDFAFTLPDNANLGFAQIMLDAEGNLSDLSGDQHHHEFQIQEFRRPEFEVSARNETVGPYFVGDEAVVAVSANYFAGGPLPNAEVTWQVTSSPGSYVPPNWPDFIFGKWIPWWFFFEPIYGEGVYSPYGPDYGEVDVETFSGVTDASGNHYLRLDFEEASEPRPFSVLAEATVIDVNRQAWAGTTSLLVHPAELYVGLRSESTFVERGTPLKIDAIVTDLDGKPISGHPVEVTAARLEWKYRQGSWREEEVDIQECELESALEPLTCDFETTLGGKYQITA
ncbi:MAG: MG2 domain-containing protein, partial [Chloroflexota bacterium]